MSLAVQRILPLAPAGVGLALMVFMVVTESEHGAKPVCQTLSELQE